MTPGYTGMIVTNDPNELDASDGIAVTITVEVCIIVVVISAGIIVTIAVDKRPKIASAAPVSAQPTNTPSADTIGNAKHEVPDVQAVNENSPLTQFPVSPFMQAIEPDVQGEE